MVFIYLVIGISTIHNYGFTWDDPWEFSYAEANLNYILTKDKSIYSHIENYYYSPANIGNVLAVITNKIFYRTLNSMATDDAYHLAGVFIGSATLLLILLFVLKEFNFLTAIISGLSFMLFPRIFGHIHNNVKDITVMFAFTLAFYTAYYFLKTKEKKWLYSFMFSLGLALNTKLLGLFIIPIIGCWIIFQYLINIKNNKRKKLLFKIDKKVIIKSIIIFLLTLYILNPAYWTHPQYFFKNLAVMNHFSGSISQSANDNYLVMIFGDILPQAQIPWYYIPLMFLIVTPIPILLLFFVGFLKVLKNWKDPLSSLLLSWILITILIYCIPGITKYNVIRHVLFLVPAICIFAGIGEQHIIIAITKNIKKVRIKTVIITTLTFIIFALPLIDILSYHPYETTFYNRLVGGIKGAEKNFEIEYWGNSYKEGSKWLNENIPENSTVVVPIAEWLPKNYVRKDIIIKTEPDFEKEFYIMYMRDKVGFNLDRINLEINQNPIHSIFVKGVPILHIYKIKTN
ncbi:MAG: glycosyltransferase family 39 protein [Nanoarchaeota archaeon]|nr:glycosyltransferase family 39 protein [Nanoarchaeota archaeon]